jgi:hypothetical protein
MSSHTLISSLTPQVDKIIGDQSAFRHNRSISDQIFFNRQILNRNGRITEQCISYLQISRKSVGQSGDILYHILTEFDEPMKQ